MSLAWREEPVTVSAASPRTVLGADEWQRAWETMAEPAGEEPERRAQRALICRCDGCGSACDLNDDGVVVSRDDEVLCHHCSAAPYLAENDL